MDSKAREALVEELTQAQHDAWPGVDADFTVNTEAIIPIIDRLLAERTPGPDIDAVLDAVNCFQYTVMDDEGGYVADIACGRGPDIPGHDKYQGTGPTRMAAIADACRKAREVQGE